MRRLLFFHAPWCPPCRFYEEHFIKPIEEIIGAEKIQRVNVQNNPFMAEKYGIDKLPVVALVDEGSVYSRNTGAIDIDEIVEWINEQS